MPRSVPGLAAVFVIVSASGLPAQVVRGRLLEDGTRAPIATALLRLLDAADSVVVSELSGDSGQLALAPTKAGTYRLRAERLGYSTVTTAPFDLLPDRTHHVEMFMGADAIPIEPLRVVTAPRQPFLEQVGFYRRRTAGIGRFFTREDIEAKRPRYPSEMLRGVPGVRLIPAQRGNTIVFSRSALSSIRGGCEILLWVDGCPLRRSHARPARGAAPQRHSGIHRRAARMARPSEKRRKESMNVAPNDRARGFTTQPVPALLAASNRCA